MTYYYAGLEYSADALQHHGIKGQRWGIRRYQNSDGTLTEAGKKHYEKEKAKEEHRQIKNERKIERGKALLNKNRTGVGAIGRTVGRQALLSIGAKAAGIALATYGGYKLNSIANTSLLKGYDSNISSQVDKLLKSQLAGQVAIKGLLAAGTIASVTKGVKDYSAIRRAEGAGYTQRKHRNGYDAYIESRNKNAG